MLDKKKKKMTETMYMATNFISVLLIYISSNEFMILELRILKFTSTSREGV